MMRKLLCWLFGGLGLVLAASAMAAPLRIITIDGPPWGFKGSDEKPTGMMYEIGNRLAEEAGLQYTNELVPYARTAFDIEAGRADVILRFGNKHLERVAQPVATIVRMPVIVIGRGGTRIRSLEELSDKTVGVVRSSAYVDAFDANTAIRKYEVNDYKVMAKMIAHGRLDAGVGSSAGLYYGALMAGVQPEQLGTPLVLGTNDFVLFYSNKTASPATIAALKRAADKLAANGEINRIVRKYTAQYSEKKADSR